MAGTCLTCRVRPCACPFDPRPPDLINNPPHYKSLNGIEAIDVIEAFALGFHLGAVVKYVLRAGKKGDAVEDLRKARWFLDRAIAQRAAPAPRALRDDEADGRMAVLAAIAVTGESGK